MRKGRTRLIDMPKDDVFSQFDHLPTAVLGEMRELFHEKRYAGGEQIFLQDGPTKAIYLVAHGRVKISRVTREGFESVLCVRRAGEYFCPVSVMDRGPQLGTAFAMSDVRILWADRDAFFALCDSHPELLSLVTGSCLAEVRNLMRRLEAFAFRSVQERLAVVLVGECRRRQERDQPRVEIRLTQQELAGLVGASRESVSRALRKLERHGVLELGRGRIVILDHDRLEQLVH